MYCLESGFESLFSSLVNSGWHDSWYFLNFVISFVNDTKTNKFYDIVLVPSVGRDVRPRACPSLKFLMFNQYSSNCIVGMVFLYSV